MTVKYRGFTIEAKREKALGGWSNVYFWAERDSDGLMALDGFTSAMDPVREILAGLKGRIDEAIATDGESECLDPKKWRGES